MSDLFDVKRVLSPITVKDQTDDAIFYREALEKRSKEMSGDAYGRLREKIEVVHKSAITDPHTSAEERLGMLRATQLLKDFIEAEEREAAEVPNG